MKTTALRFTLLAILGLSLQSPAVAGISAAKAERVQDRLELTWASPDPVDVYEADHANGGARAGRLVAKAVRTGAYSLEAGDGARHYFTLVDAKDHKSVVAAERLVPLAQGSNFRDIGGYRGAGGKHVRWGLIYRSAGQPLLSADDVAKVKAMGVTQLVDLRSSEERVLAPTRITGVAYAAVGYSMTDLMPQASQGQARNGLDVYHRFPEMLAPQLRIIFRDLLSGQAPLVYNCSAGQDRTGFTTAVILSALGVSRDQIVADYHLSTKYRRPEWEMPKLNAAEHPNDPVVRMFAGYQSRPNGAAPEPLKDAAGQPFLKGAFDEIDVRWGSVDGYLTKEIGLRPADITKLRRMYLQ